MATTEMSRVKCLIALSIVVGCFAILWPRIFYPMFQASISPPVKEQTSGPCCGVVFEGDKSVSFLAEICSLVLKHDFAMELTTLPLEHGGRPPEKVVALCREELLKKCSVDVNDVVRSDVDGAVHRRRQFQQLRAQNLTHCLKINFNIDEDTLIAKKSYPQHIISTPRHMKPERPAHLHPELMHPALREKGRVLPTRTIEKHAKPGPIPGMRPPMGGPGHVISPPSGSGMGILMPLYTIGIVIFFVYTIMKVLFKKQDDQEPRIKNFHLDPEQRKFLFAEEYNNANSETSMNDYIQRRERLEQMRRSRSKTPETPVREDVIIEEKRTELREEKASMSPVEEEEEPETILKMDTQGKGLGFIKEEQADVGTESENESDLLHLDEQQFQAAYAALKAQKEAEVDQLRRRLEETEKAMERIVAQMGNVSDKLSPSLMAEIFAQSQLLRQDKEALEAAELELKQEGQFANVMERFSQSAMDQLIQDMESIPENGSTAKPIDVSEEANDINNSSGEDAKLTVMGMEVTVALENGQKMNRAATPVKDLLPKPEKCKTEIVEEIPSVFLDAALPPETQLVVSEAECRAEAVPIEQLDLEELEYETSPVVLSGKMTLSVIGMELMPDPGSSEEVLAEEEDVTPVKAEGKKRKSSLREDEPGSPTRIHRVRFVPQPEELIFVPTEEQEQDVIINPERGEAEEDKIDDDLVQDPNVIRAAAPVVLAYRPPTPPLHHEPEAEDKEFLTYEELEEAGEIADEMKDRQERKIADITSHLVICSDDIVDSPVSQSYPDDSQRIVLPSSDEVRIPVCEPALSDNIQLEIESKNEGEKELNYTVPEVENVVLFDDDYCQELHVSELRAEKQKFSNIQETPQLSDDGDFHKEEIPVVDQPYKNVHEILEIQTTDSVEDELVEEQEPCGECTVKLQEPCSEDVQEQTTGETECKPFEEKAKQQLFEEREEESCELDEDEQIEEQSVTELRQLEQEQEAQEPCTELAEQQQLDEEREKLELNAEHIVEKLFDEEQTEPEPSVEPDVEQDIAEIEQEREFHKEPIEHHQLNEIHEKERQLENEHEEREQQGELVEELQLAEKEDKQGPCIEEEMEEQRQEERESCLERDPDEIQQELHVESVEEHSHDEEQDRSNEWEAEVQLDEKQTVQQSYEENVEEERKPQRDEEEQQPDEERFEEQPFKEEQTEREPCVELEVERNRDEVQREPVDKEQHEQEPCVQHDIERRHDEVHAQWTPHEECLEAGQFEEDKNEQESYVGRDVEQHLDEPQREGKDQYSCVERAVEQQLGVERDLEQRSEGMQEGWTDQDSRADQYPVEQQLGEERIEPSAEHDREWRLDEVQKLKLCEERSGELEPNEQKELESCVEHDVEQRIDEILEERNQETPACEKPLEQIHEDIVMDSEVLPVVCCHDNVENEQIIQDLSSLNTNNQDSQQDLDVCHEEVETINGVQSNVPLSGEPVESFHEEQNDFAHEILREREEMADENLQNDWEYVDKDQDLPPEEEEIEQDTPVLAKEQLVAEEDVTKLVQVIDYVETRAEPITEKILPEESNDSLEMVLSRIEEQQGQILMKDLEEEPFPERLILQEEKEVDDLPTDSEEIGIVDEQMMDDVPLESTKEILDNEESEAPSISIDDGPEAGIPTLESVDNFEGSLDVTAEPSFPGTETAEMNEAQEVVEQNMVLGCSEITDTKDTETLGEETLQHIPFDLAQVMDNVLLDATPDLESAATQVPDLDAVCVIDAEQIIISHYPVQKVDDDRLNEQINEDTSVSCPSENTALEPGHIVQADTLAAIVSSYTEPITLDSPTMEINSTPKDTLPDHPDESTEYDMSSGFGAKEVSETEPVPPARTEEVEFFTQRMENTPEEISVSNEIVEDIFIPPGRSEYETTPVASTGTSELLICEVIMDTLLENNTAAVLHSQKEIELEDDRVPEPNQEEEEENRELADHGRLQEDETITDDQQENIPAGELKEENQETQSRDLAHDQFYSSGLMETIMEDSAAEALSEHEDNNDVIEQNLSEAEPDVLMSDFNENLASHQLNRSQTREEVDLKEASSIQDEVDTVGTAIDAANEKSFNDVDDAVIRESVPKEELFEDDSLEILPAVLPTKDVEELVFAEDEMNEIEEVESSTVPQDQIFADESVPAYSKEIENTVEELVQKILAESITDAVLNRDLFVPMSEEESEENLGTIQEQEEEWSQESEQGSCDTEEIVVPESILLDIENQLVPVGSYLTSCEPEQFTPRDTEPREQEQGKSPSIPQSSNDSFEQDRDVDEVEHSLEQLIKQESPEVQGPFISGFIIREDYPEEDVQLTEEDILQARKEIEEIKKLLADVSSGAVAKSEDLALPEGSSAHQSLGSQSPIIVEKEDIAVEIANAMADDVPAAPTPSKGSSPEMEEYEVITNAENPSEKSEGNTEGSKSTEDSEKKSTSETVSPSDNNGFELVPEKCSPQSSLPSPLTPTTEATFEQVATDRLPSAELTEEQDGHGSQ